MRKRAPRVNRGSVHPEGSALLVSAKSISCSQHAVYREWALNCRCRSVHDKVHWVAKIQTLAVRSLLPLSCVRTSSKRGPQGCLVPVLQKCFLRARGKASPTHLAEPQSRSAHRQRISSTRRVPHPTSRPPPPTTISLPSSVFSEHFDEIKNTHSTLAGRVGREAAQPSSKNPGGFE